MPLHLKQNFPPMIWIFTEGEGIESRLHFKIFSTLKIWTTCKSNLSPDLALMQAVFRQRAFLDFCQLINIIFLPVDSWKSFQTAHTQQLHLFYWLSKGVDRHCITKWNDFDIRILVRYINVFLQFTAMYKITRFVISYLTKDKNVMKKEKLNFV